MSNESFLLILCGGKISLLKIITSQVFLCRNFLLYDTRNIAAVKTLGRWTKPISLKKIKHVFTQV